MFPLGYHHQPTFQTATPELACHEQRMRDGQATTTAPRQNGSSTDAGTAPLIFSGLQPSLLQAYPVQAPEQLTTLFGDPAVAAHPTNPSNSSSGTWGQPSPGFTSMSTAGSSSARSSAVPSTNILVAGLTPKIDDDKLRQMFDKFGTVVSAMVMLDVNTGRSRGFGFVQYDTAEQATEAVRNMDRYPLGNNVLNVTFSCHSGRAKASPALFIRNLPSWFTPVMLDALLSRFGDVQSVRLSSEGLPGGSDAAVMLPLAATHVPAGVSQSIELAQTAPPPVTDQAAPHSQSPGDLASLLSFTHPDSTAPPASAPRPPPTLSLSLSSQPAGAPGPGTGAAGLNTSLTQAWQLLETGNCSGNTNASQQQVPSLPLRTAVVRFASEVNSATALSALHGARELRVPIAQLPPADRDVLEFHSTLAISGRFAEGSGINPDHRSPLPLGPHPSGGSQAGATTGYRADSAAKSPNLAAAEGLDPSPFDVTGGALNALGAGPGSGRGSSAAPVNGRPSSAVSSVTTSQQANNDTSVSSLPGGLDDLISALRMKQQHTQSHTLTNTITTHGAIGSEVVLSDLPVIPGHTSGQPPSPTAAPPSTESPIPHPSIELRLATDGAVMLSTLQLHGSGHAAPLPGGASVVVVPLHAPLLVKYHEATSIRKGRSTVGAATHHHHQRSGDATAGQGPPRSPEGTSGGSQAPLSPPPPQQTSFHSMQHQSVVGHRGAIQVQAVNGNHQFYVSTQATVGSGYSFPRREGPPPKQQQQQSTPSTSGPFVGFQQVQPPFAAAGGAVMMPQPQHGGGGSPGGPAAFAVSSQWHPPQFMFQNSSNNNHAAAALGQQGPPFALNSAMPMMLAAMQPPHHHHHHHGYQQAPPPPVAAGPTHAMPYLVMLPQPQPSNGPCLFTSPTSQQPQPQPPFHPLWMGQQPFAIGPHVLPMPNGVPPQHGMVWATTTQQPMAGGVPQQYQFLYPSPSPQ